MLQPSTFTSIAAAEEDASLDSHLGDERYSAALEFLLTLLETADYGPLRSILTEDKGAMVKMLLGRMYMALGRTEDEEEDLEEWLQADDVSGRTEAMRDDYPG